MKLGKAVIFFIFVLVVAAGAYVHLQKEAIDYVYKGESENWSATYRVTGDTQWTEHRVTLRFTGEHPEQVGSINYSVKTTAGSTAARGDTLDGGRTVSAGGGGNGAIPFQNEEIPLDVEWAGNKEHIVLLPRK